MQLGRDTVEAGREGGRKGGSERMNGIRQTPLVDDQDRCWCGVIFFFVSDLRATDYLVQERQYRPLGRFACLPIHPSTYPPV